MQVVTGWADGGLRKYELKSYLQTGETGPKLICNEEQPNGDYAEWSLGTVDAQKDFIRNLVVIEGRLICCTNLGNLHLIETNTRTNVKDNQKLLFKSILLSSYTVMAKAKIENKWILAIGTLKG